MVTQDGIANKMGFFSQSGEWSSTISFWVTFHQFDPALLEPWLSEEELQRIENSNEKRIYYS